MADMRAETTSVRQIARELGVPAEAFTRVLSHKAAASVRRPTAVLEIGP